MRECVRIYQWLDICEILDYFGHNLYIACTMTQDAPLQWRGGRVVYLVQVALY